MSDVKVTFTVEHHDETTDKVHPAGTTAAVDRKHASNLVYRGLARYDAADPAAAPAAVPASAGDTKKQGKE